MTPIELLTELTVENRQQRGQIEGMQRHIDQLAATEQHLRANIAGLEKNRDWHKERAECLEKTVDRSAVINQELREQLKSLKPKRKRAANQ